MRPLVTRFLFCFQLFLLISCAGEGPGPAPSTGREAPGDAPAIDPAQAATVSGRVLFEGEPPPDQEIDLSSEPECAKMHSGPIFSGQVQVDENGGLADVFVTIESDFKEFKFPAPSRPVVIDQTGCVYAPRVVGVQAGQDLLVTNNDPVTHNVHPLPRFNRESNRTQSSGSEPLILPFGRPELMIPVKCNLHPWMVAFVNVVSHPFFAVTAGDGSFTIRGLPPGEYTLVAVHERLGRQELTVSVEAGGSTPVEFLYHQETR